jgi:hypothetical protein
MYHHNNDVPNHNSEKSGGWGDREVHGNMLGETFLYNNFSDIPEYFCSLALFVLCSFQKPLGGCDYSILALLQTT